MYLTDPGSSCGGGIKLGGPNDAFPEPPSPSTTSSSSSIRSVMSTVASSYMSSMQSVVDKLDDHGIAKPNGNATTPPSASPGQFDMSEGQDGNHGCPYSEVPAGTQAWKVLAFEREVRRHILSKMVQDSGFESGNPDRGVSRFCLPETAAV